MAAGLAAAIGAVLTSMVDSRSTLAGTMLVAMAVSALGQAMRAPLGRLEQRFRLGAGSDQAGQPSAPALAAAPPVRARRQGGIGRSILTIGLLGFLIGMGVIGARDIAQAKAMAARLIERLQSDAPIRILVELAPTDPAPPALKEAGEDEAEPKQAIAPAVDQPARRAAATPVSEPAANRTSARPTPEPSAPSSKTVATPAPRSDAPTSTKPDQSGSTTAPASPKSDAP